MNGALPMFAIAGAFWALLIYGFVTGHSISNSVLSVDRGKSPLVFWIVQILTTILASVVTFAAIMVATGHGHA